ncbi:MAG: choice-of-anchor E domain-containing protein, partial [Phycisphaerales bacterium]|nr:choice-of-anchor E domain-containing protein [Phycisphaerales bacterium]
MTQRTQSRVGLRGLRAAAALVPLALGTTNVVAGGVADEVHVETFAFPLAPGAITLTLPRFDDQGGDRVLQEVTLDLDGQLTARITAENDSDLPAPEFALNFAGFMTADLRGLSTFVAVTVDLTSPGVGPTDGVAGSGPDFYDFGSMDAAASASDATAISLGDFIGVGPIDIDVFATGGFALSGTTDATITVDGFSASGQLTLTYRSLPAPPIACCLPTGACTMVSGATCLGSGGVGQGTGSTCGGVTCPAPVGACCLPGGGCTIMTGGECDASGGIYEGHDVPCGGCPVAAIGACCFPDGTCGDLDEGDCLAGGGTHQGDGTVCASSRCFGACCFFDGTCELATLARCNQFAGIFQGHGVLCVAGTCPTLTGACCLGDGGCFTGSVTDCVVAGGLYAGSGSDCVTACLPVERACCLP